MSAAGGKKEGEKEGHTAGVGAIAGEAGLDTLVAGLL